MKKTYHVKGISHHAVADRLGEWLPNCEGRRVTLAVEPAEENEIGVECVAVFDVDVHLGYIADDQKHELLRALRRGGGRKTLRAHIVGYDPGKGPEGRWSQAKLMVEVAKWPAVSDGADPMGEAVATATAVRSPWEDWTYEGPLLPRAPMARRLGAVLPVLDEMIDADEPWSEEVRQYVEAFCRWAFVDLSGEMRLDMLRLLHWLEHGEAAEMRQMAERVHEVMSNMGSEEVRLRHVHGLIEQSTRSAECLAIIESERFDGDYLDRCLAAMPYRVGGYGSDEANEKRFVAKLYYDTTLTRQKLEQIYSVLALSKRRRMVMAERAPTFVFHFHDKVGQSIANVEHMEVRFDKDMQMQVTNVEELNAPSSAEAQQDDAQQHGLAGRDADVAPFHFIHPEVDDAEAASVNQQVLRLVSRFGIQQICDYLNQLASERKILLPPSVKVAYDELRRMGMPEGEGFAYKTFEKYYKR